MWPSFHCHDLAKFGSSMPFFDPVPSIGAYLSTCPRSQRNNLSKPTNHVRPMLPPHMERHPKPNRQRPPPAATSTPRLTSYHAAPTATLVSPTGYALTRSPWSAAVVTTSPVVLPARVFVRDFRIGAVVHIAVSAGCYLE